MNRIKRVLIAYSDESMKYSLKQLGIQAKYIKNVDKVILYTKKDLPKLILNSPLMQYKRGGGYWVWKPYLIWKTLQDFPDGTDICYVDAGCSLQGGDQWDIYFNKLKEKPVLLFQYAPYIQKWKKEMGCGSSAIECWSKKATLDYFDTRYGKGFHNFSKIWGGLIFCKGKDNIFIKEWLDITLQHPEIVMDPLGDELQNQHKAFCGEHRHDQSVITPLAYFHKELCTILPEVFDENRKSSIIVASRNRIDKNRYRQVFWKFHLQGILGKNAYDTIKIYLYKLTH